MSQNGAVGYRSPGAGCILGGQGDDLSVFLAERITDRETLPIDRPAIARAEQYGVEPGGVDR
jgi:hypothetical protein